MKHAELLIRLDYITGLKEIVLEEIGKTVGDNPVRTINDCVYLGPLKNLDSILNLRSVLRACIVTQDNRYTPRYISNHKSILGDIVSIILTEDERRFKTYKLTCAGSASPEARSITKYIEETFGLSESEEADLKMHIIKLDETTWEVGAQITPRPLSLRDYKVIHMSGAMDPTIAYAVNSLCNLEKAKSYLNIFSGSATLLIEAGLCYSNLEKLVGFDNDKKHISLAIQNVKKAGLIKKIELKEENIFNKPELGSFDVITSDLPFGMSISKDEDLESLYQYFIEYCEEALNPKGTLVAYTSKHELFEEIVAESKFTILKALELKFITNVDAYLRPKIFVCQFRS